MAVAELTQKTNYREFNVLTQQTKSMKLNAFNLGMPRLWLPPKIILIMKLVIVILFTCLMQVSAAGFAQKVTLKANNASLKAVFSSIRTQTGYGFIYTSEVLKGAKRVNVNLKDAALKDALEVIFGGQPVSFEIRDNTVIVKDKAPSFLERLIDRFDNIDVHGRVVDEQGAPLAGATVVVVGGTGTKTDQNGEFYLRGVDEKAMIEVSFVGYETLTVKVGKELPIALKLGDSKLDEIQVIAYGTTTQRLSTGNHVKISSEDISKQPVNNIMATLAGRVPGMTVNETNGNPGASLNVQIRGKNSLASGTQPLFLLDGVPFPSSVIGNPAYVIGIANGGQSPIASLNPQDIESIEVLKDADATAIYGSRGANGVVLITTKKGSSGKTKLNANISKGVAQVTRMLPLLNTQQYVKMRKEAFRNDNISMNSTNAYDLLNWDTTRYTNWEKQLIGGTASLKNANVTISGGNANTSFLIGGSYSKQTTVYPGDFADTKGGLHLNLQHTSNDKKFSLTFGAIYGDNVNNLLITDLANSITIAPNAPLPYDNSGKLVWSENGVAFSNPMAALLQTSKNSNENLNGNLTMKYLIAPGLLVNVNSGYTSMNVNQLNTLPISAQMPSTTTVGSANYGNSSYSNWILEPHLNYHKNISKGQLDVLLGTSFQKDLTYSSLIKATGFTNDALIESAAAASTSANSVTISTTTVDYRYQSIFGRANYIWDTKYIVDLNFRRDGSSRFGPGRQFGNFGSIGSAWIFSEEKLIKEFAPHLSYGKLRGSYGITGNDQITDYAFFDTYSSPALGNGLVPTRLYNPDFAWEKNNKLEFALELGFLSDRILFTGSWFRNRSGNQLVAYALPGQTGFTSYISNLDALVQNEGYEFTLTTINVKNKVISWKSDFNISFNRNKLLAFPDLQSSTYANTYFIGQSIYSKTFFHFLGVDPTTGIYQFSGTSNPKDLTSLKDFTPKFFGSFNNSFSYKNFELSIFFQFTKQDGYNYLANVLSNNPGTIGVNEPTYVLNRWRKTGDVANIQKFSTSTIARTAISNYGQSDAVITDASFIRLKNAYLSYSLPLKFVKRIGVESIKVFTQSQNLFTWTKYKGFDPETGSSPGIYLPPLRVFTGGIQLSL